MTPRARCLALLAPALLLSACAELKPVMQPPLLASPDPMAGITTREQTVQRLGPPLEVRASDVGEVLVYRRVTVLDVNPNRYYGEVRGEQLNQYQLLLVYVDPEGQVVRWTIEAE